MKKAIFLDRDGVINHTLFKMGKQRAPYTLEEFKFIDGVPEAIAAFKKAGFILIVVTNQPDVARGWVSMDQVNLLNHHVHSHLSVDEIMACFHTEKDNCECRKPKPGMILSAAQKFGIDVTQSFMVGDRMSDVDAGKRAGCRSILVGQAESDVATVLPDYECLNLLEASDWILSHS
jgi:D-glycero-D-manno-heptose 1,7-bisphosphate phosphatase